MLHSKHLRNLLQERFLHHYFIQTNSTSSPMAFVTHLVNHCLTLFLTQIFDLEVLKIVGENLFTLDFHEWGSHGERPTRYRRKYSGVSENTELYNRETPKISIPNSTFWSLLLYPCAGYGGVKKCGLTSTWSEARKALGRGKFLHDELFALL